MSIYMIQQSNIVDSQFDLKKYKKQHLIMVYFYFLTKNQGAKFKKCKWHIFYCLFGKIEINLVIYKILTKYILSSYKFFKIKAMRTQGHKLQTSWSLRKQGTYNNNTLMSSNRQEIQDPEYYQFSYGKQQEKYQNKQSFITLVQISSLSITDKLYDLAKSSSYSKAQLYGYSIEKLKKQLKQQKKAGMSFVWACFNSLNWEGVSFATLRQYVENFPTQEDIVQEIRIQNNQIKFNKQNKTLSYSLSSKQWKLQDTDHILNRFANRKYEKSLTKLSFDIQAYQFNGLIRQIQSNQLLIGIRTDNSIYVISPKNQLKRFDISSQDIKIHESRLFFIQRQGNIGSILLQNLYVPKLNQVELQSLPIVDYKCDQDEFLIDVQKFMIIAKLTVNDQQSKIQFKTFLKRQAKFEFPINLDLEQDEQVIYRGALYAGKYIHFLILTGWEGKIDKIHQIKFLIV